MSKAGIRLGVMASGRGSNLQSIISGIESQKIDAEIGVVISDRSGCLALARGREHSIRSIFLDPNNFSGRKAYDRRVIELLRESQVDLVVLAGYMRIVTVDFINAFQDRIINIHPSLLPSFPGMKVQGKALSWGVKFSGCTVHLVEEKVDEGPIIIQAAVPVYADDSEETLADRILREEHKILPQAIQWFSERRVQIQGRHVVIQGSKPPLGDSLISPPLEKEW